MVATSKTGLIVGDLCLDLHVSVPDRGIVAQPLLKGGDVTLHGESSVRAGGSAWLFAEALVASSEITPMMIAVTGDDWAGQFLMSATVSRGFPKQGILALTSKATDIVCSTSFASMERLMIRPAKALSNSLPHRFIRDFLQSTCPEDVAFAWISGYAIELLATERQIAVRGLCKELRARNIPIILDLVPHDFRKRVGSIAEVERRMGQPDILVAEFKTITSVGYTPQSNEASGIESAMVATAARAAAGRRAAIIQHRLGQNIYGQAVVADGRSTMTRLTIPQQGLRGLGDRLAVEALKFVGLT